MDYDPENPFPRMDKSDPKTIEKFFQEEEFHVLLPFYPMLIEAKTFRRICMRFIRELSDRFRDDDLVVPYLALTIYDHNISCLKLPENLMERENDVKIFVTCCFVSAWRMRDSEFSPTPSDYEMYENLNVSMAEMLEFITEIEDTLISRNCMPPVTALCFLDFLIGLLPELDNSQMTCLKSFATHKLYALKYDLRLAGFKPSIMAAAALVSSVNTFYEIKMECVINKFINCKHLNNESLKRSVEMLIPGVTVCIPESPDHVVSNPFPKELTIDELLESPYAHFFFDLDKDTEKRASPGSDPDRSLGTTETSTSGREKNTNNQYYS